MMPSSQTNIESAVREYLLDNTPFQDLLQKYHVSKSSLRKRLRQILEHHSSPWQLNATGLPSGTARSIIGYAGESFAIGRALECGFNLFFKAWRDSPYDSVLDYAGVLFRIEIKSSRSNTLSLTAGGRTGAQIVRGTSREHVLRKEDCDFLIGVNVSNGDCYVVPIEFIQAVDKKSQSLSKLAPFKEKWALFTGIQSPYPLQPADLRSGFSHLRNAERSAIIRRLLNRVRIAGLTPPNITALASTKQTQIAKIWLLLATLT